ncbi:hypothetical protein COU58_02875 [Candidatus Pacearchaeota archaeon CG10_big_fil_rev_8_21_14_0_10_32_42]|nr:MAG: hypothetical protein COU58_02875 [Candidatus Pacearchaeota archaeon CG10_big_fil_rev_8_21_14_0_10_32_42]
MVKITISGLPGSGKTTVAKFLSKTLEFNFISVGDLHGLIAGEKGITISELMEKGRENLDIHREMDKKIAQIGKTRDDFVIEGWIAYHFIPNSFKIFLFAKENKTARRIMDDKRGDEPTLKNLEDTKKQIKKRLNDSKEGFKKAYGINFLDKKNYNLIIDTSNLTPEEVVKIILSSLKNINNFKQKKFLNLNKMHDIFSKNKERPISEKPKEIIEVDFREKNSLVPSELIRNGFSVEFKELKVADYILKGVAIERKSAKDFFSSVFDKRIFSQLSELNQYEKRLLIIEGNLERENRLHENSLKGLLLSITLQYKIPIIFSKNEEETAKYLKILGEKQKKEASINAMKKGLSPEEELLFIMESFPKIGPSKAKKLLEKFDSIKLIATSSEKELTPILGKGAKEFKEIINRKYSKKI